MNNNFAIERDIIKKCLEINPKFTQEDYEDVLRCLKITLKNEIKNGSNTGYKIPNLGVIYIKYDYLSKYINVKKRDIISNWQIRFEKILGEIMHNTIYNYVRDLRVKKGRLHHLKKKYGFTIEDLEKIQNNEFYK
jgi:hypothetical protein